jgi:hypothetical protein
MVVQSAPLNGPTKANSRSNIDDKFVRVVLVAVLSTLPYESLTPLTYVFSKEHILVLPVLRCVNDIDGTFL